MSEALILESVNPQYDKILFIEFPPKYKLTTCCVQKLFFCFCFDIQNNICTQHVLNLYFSGDSMNNLSSYCGLTNFQISKNESFRHRFTCTKVRKYVNKGLTGTVFWQNVPCLFTACKQQNGCGKN